MFPERDAFKRSFSEKLGSGLISKTFPDFFNQLKPIARSLKFGVSPYSRARPIGE